MRSETIFSVLADPTRLRAILLMHSEDELCVCELTHALGESQPKISRHLAYMRDAGIVKGRREGTWVHYRLNPALPAWAREVISATHSGLSETRRFKGDRQRLARMGNRPEKACA